MKKLEKIRQLVKDEMQHAEVLEWIEQLQVYSI